MENTAGLFRLEEGVVSVIENPNISPMTLVITTQGGTVISVPMPIGYRCEVTAGDDIVSALLFLEDQESVGPRAVD